MLSAKSILLNGSLTGLVFSLLISGSVKAQDNSPYSRFGLGNMMPLSNSASRGMGGITAAYVDYTGINFLNPASYAAFQAIKENRGNKLQSGRAIFDVGINITNRKLIEPNTPQSYTSSDLLFSYIQLGVPLKKNWGLSFGIRPVSRINYRIDRREMLKDPNTGAAIDSAITTFRGDGGSYLPTIGTGCGFTLSDRTANKITKAATLRFGTNVGYMFGNRETKTLLNLLDTVDVYAASSHTTTTSFGSLFLNAGTQYQFEVRDDNKKRVTTFRLGASGNWKQTLKGSQDRKVETYTLGNAGEQLQIDSVLEQKDIKGDIIYPGMYKVGALLQRIHDDGRSWTFGVDYSQGKWSDYRFFGQQDNSVKDNWEIAVGAAFSGKASKNYLTNVVYRLGFYTGPDYIDAGGKLPQFGITAGLGLPIRNYNRLTAQQTFINLGFEYGKRGNDDNLLRENLFRMTIGLNLNDFWFTKRKYD